MIGEELLQAANVGSVKIHSQVPLVVLAVAVYGTRSHLGVEAQSSEFEGHGGRPSVFSGDIEQLAVTQ